MLTIKSVYADHEGGTKFYKLILVNDGKNTVLISNWGSGSSGLVQDNCGQSKLLQGTLTPVRDEYLATRSSKAKRGYIFGSETNREIRTREELQEWCRQCSEKTRALLLSVFLDSLDGKDFIVRSDDPPKERVKPITREESIRLSENPNFGSW